MNWLDIIIIIVLVIITLSILIMQFMAAKDDEFDVVFGLFVLYVAIAMTIMWIFFLVIDKSSGSTLGTITSVDKSFWGTTNLYIKTTENNEEKYCIEFDEELEQTAKDLIGKKVKISYGTRVGFYSTGKCHKSPVEKIELFE